MIFLFPKVGYVSFLEGTLPETNILPENGTGWNTTVDSFWGAFSLFSGAKMLVFGVSVNNLPDKPVLVGRIVDKCGRMFGCEKIHDPFRKMCSKK